MNPSGIDPILMAVMRLAEHGVSITITLTINGTSLSGRIIGQRQYLQKVRKQFNSHVHEENWPGLFDILTLFEEASEHSEEEFMHIEDAAPLYGSPTGRGPKGLWRIKMSEIDGFSFGT